MIDEARAMSTNADKIVYVEWTDSCALDGVWKARSNIEDLDPNPIVSVGIIIRDEKDFLTIAAHVSQHQIAGEMCIPRACIKSIELLARPPRGRKRKRAEGGHKPSD